MSFNRQLEIYTAVYDQLFEWCREHDFAGHDPFDALNSRFFQSTALNKSKSVRLIWTQLVKRSPADLRTISRVPPQRNAKGIALFALAQLARFRQLKTPETEAQTRGILAEVMAMRLPGYSGAAWGYNFDWQSRKFFAPQNTATIVPTAFAARALMEAARELQDEEYLSTAQSVCEFILKDLKRSVETKTELCLSYSPHSTTRIYNASLLAAEVLAGVGAMTSKHELLDWAERAARYVITHQRPDGSWTYGDEPSQQWIDNFHTAFVLFSLKRIIEAGSLGTEFQQALKSGYDFWRSAFFLADGWPKYYHDDPYPADAHAGASAIVTFLELGDLDENSTHLAERVASWTIRNLRDERGFFYYQKRRFYTVKKPYMRWSQAWMLYALGRLLETTCQSHPTSSSDQM
ncbi:MAG TPA: hypothetical protein VF074_06850 [Pyrinomonadaceae bacterium]